MTSQFEQDWTRAPATPELSDPHPGGSLDSLVDLEALAEATERDALAKEVNDPVLNTLRQSQQQAFAQAARNHPLFKGKPLSDEALVEAVNQLQISNDVVERQAYVAILNQTIDKTAELLEQAGVSPQSLGGAITSAINHTGQTLSAGVTDLSKLDTTGILTILGAGGGMYLLSGGRRGLSIGALGVATIIQSPELTQGTIDLAAGAIRGAGQLALTPVKAAVHTVDIFDNLMSPGLTDSIKDNAVGFAQGMFDSLAYTFDGDYSPEFNPNRNPLMQEFLHLGEKFAPTPLVPILQYLNKVREGKRLVEPDLPTRDELEAAAIFIRQVETANPPLVTMEEFIQIDNKRMSGQALSDEEKQKYVLCKYMTIVKHNFLGENGLEPQATLMQAAYASASGNIDNLDTALGLSPALMAELKNADFEWTQEQIRALENNAEGLFGKLNFDTLTKGGFVGLALTAYLTLTYAGMMFGAIKGGLAGAKKGKEKVGEWWNKIDDTKTLNNNQQKAVEDALKDPNKNKTLKPLIAALVAGGVLGSKSEFASEVVDLKLKDLDASAITTLSDSVSGNRRDIRKNFFTLLKTPALNGTEAEKVLQARQDFYAFRDMVQQLRVFESTAERGKVGTLSLGAGKDFHFTKEVRENFKFTTVREDFLQGINPRNYWRWLGNKLSDSQTIRIKNTQGKIEYLRLRQIRKDGEVKFQFNARDDKGWVDFSPQDMSVA